MKNLTNLILALAIGSTALSAQTSSSDVSRVGSARATLSDLAPVTRALDIDQNGELSPSEIAYAALLLSALDLDDDGTLSYAELQPDSGVYLASRSANRAAIDPVVLALDANGDGVISAAEIANAPKSLSSLDANKDGTLTRDELRAPATSI